MISLHLFSMVLYCFKLFQVNENGLLSFLAEIPSYFNVQFPLDYPLIAALYSDVDCRGSGSVWYRITADPTLLSRAQSRIESQFQVGFQPEELIIATWDRVGYYEAVSTKVSVKLMWLNMLYLLSKISGSVSFIDSNASQFLGIDRYLREFIWLGPFHIQ